MAKGDLIYLYADGNLGHNEQHTSTESACKSEKLHQKVAELILHELSHRPKWGLTDDELEDILERPHQTISSVRCGLKKKFFVEDSDLTRITKHGRKAIAWILTDKGVERVQEPTGVHRKPIRRNRGDDR